MIDSDSHLSFPSFQTEEPAAQPSKQIIPQRLYVGNLATTVDEYTLLQLFGKHGQIAKLDFLFHKAGPLKGKPRGYAFVEYIDPNDALKALSGLNDKLLRGRKIVVTHAHQAPLEQHGAVRRKAVNEAGRPTALSMIKTGTGTKSADTDNKIVLMEAKLRQMERDSASTSSSLPPPPPSLPLKPAPSAEVPPSDRMSQPRPTLPPLPEIKASPSPVQQAKKPKGALAGIKIIKTKKKS